MSPSLIAVIVVVASLVYITIGSLAYEIACRVVPPDARRLSSPHPGPALGAP